ncbi:sensor histidine kinase [Nocardioides litoris]|uniref:sensor histidine kinase n=1 Tax=Nocardioides litoris TaxID=1926648 RepID=UPI001FEA8CC1|nr:histidine kinase [Nocardioides litoris]
MSDLVQPRPEDYQPRLSWWGHTWRTLLVLGISAVVWVTVAEGQSVLPRTADLLVGLPTLVLVCFRRRYPMTVAVVTSVVGAISSVAAGPAVLASVSLATRREWRRVVVVAVLSLASATLYSELYPPADPLPWWVTLGTNLTFTAGVMAWGMYIGSRRELLWTLRARAERAEAEQELRASQSRLAERSRIAREMHDVLAHRISQISMRAGALAYREDLAADDLRTEVGIIRDAANEALTDLRGVLGVLRDGDGELTHAPQPTWADVETLVEEARRTGMRVAYDAALADAPVPDVVGRTLYRIVQEGITNARKHAPGAELVVEVSGSPDDGIDVVLANPVGFGPSAAPGSGLGLVGLAERAVLRGGRIEHGVTDGTWVLRGWIPWAA